MYVIKFIIRNVYSFIADRAAWQDDLNIGEKEVRTVQCVSQVYTVGDAYTWL